MIMDDKESLSDRPQTPREEDCCGNSCSPCVFDIHKKLLDQWEKNKKTNIRIKCKNLLELTLYKTFEVIEINRINNDYVTIILHYEGRINLDNNNDGCISLNPGQHVIINILSWSKPFTPITWSDNSLEFLVRIYPKSNFTDKLKNLQVGDEIKVRGPYGDFQYHQNSFRKIIMFCMGSGIVPFYPIIKSIVDDEQEETRIQLIAGFRSVSQFPLKKQLQVLAEYWNIECRFHVTEAVQTEIINNIEVKQGQIDEDTCKSTLQKELPESTLVLICGTEEFHEALSRWTQECNYVNYYVFK